MPERRVLIVTDEMEIGGSQRQIAHLAEGLAAAGWSPTLLYFRNDSFLVDRLRARGIRVVRIDKRGRFDPAFFVRLVRFLRAGRFELAHCFSLTAETWLLAARAFAPGFALVASVRGLCREYRPWQWRLKRRICRHAAAIVANSRAGAVATAEHARVAPERIEVIRNGVEIPPAIDADERRAMRVGLLGHDPPTIALFVGRLVALKNVPVLLRALSLVPAITRPHLVLAGEGPMLGELRATAQRLGVAAHAHFLGARDDTASLMQCADVLVLPSREEGLSNVVLEAMAAGCPVIASAVGGNPELVEHARTGLLFPPDDATALAAALVRVACDPDLRLRFATSAGFRARSEFSIETMVRRTIACYERCLERAAPQHGLVLGDDASRDGHDARPRAGAHR